MEKVKSSPNKPLARIELRRYVAFATAVIIAVIWIFSTADVLTSRDSLLENAKLRVERTTSKLSGFIQSSMSAVDFALRNIRDKVIENPTAISSNHHIQEHFWQSVALLETTVPHVIELFVTDSNNEVVYAKNPSENDQDEVLSIIDAVVHSPPPFGRIIGKPYQDKRTGSLVLAVSRKIVGKDNRFLGTVNAVVLLSRLTDFFRSIDLQNIYFVGVSRHNGQLLAVYGPIQQQDLDAIRIPSGSTIKDDEIIFNRTKVADTPLTAFAGVSVERVLEPWHRTAFFRNLAAFGFSLLVVALAYILYRQIVQRVDAETKVRYFSHAVEQSPASVIITDTDGTIEYVNERCLSTSGYTREDLVGHSLTLLFDGSEVPKTGKEFWSSLRNGETWRGELPNRRKDGSLYWESLVIYPLRERNKKVSHYIALKEDITERRGMEIQLRESEKRFKDFADVASDWIWETDADNRFTFVSERYYDVMKFSADQIMGMNPTEIKDSRPLGIEAELVQQCFEKQKPFRNLIFRSVNAIGSERVLRLNGKPLYDDKGSFVGFRGSGSDITAEVEATAREEETMAQFREALDTVPVQVALFDAEDRLVLCNKLYVSGRPTVSDADIMYETFSDLVRDSAYSGRIPEARNNEETWIAERMARHRKADNTWHEIRIDDGWHMVLEHKTKNGYRLLIVQNVTELRRTEIDLRAAVNRAEIANRAKTEFLANMSHELRTPLNSIIGFSDILVAEALGPLGNDKYQEYVKDINDAGRLLLDLISDILDIARIEVDGLKLMERKIDITQLIASSERLIRQRAFNAGLTVTSTIADDCPRLYGDERRIKQILINLLSNAVKFTPQGGSISMEARGSDDGGITMIVADTGIGIAQDQIEIAMSTFGQADGSPSRSYEGAGLGLPLSKKLAELHGGDLTLESEVGVGTTITLTFPPERAF